MLDLCALTQYHHILQHRVHYVNFRVYSFIIDNEESERAENDIFWVGIEENLLFLVSCL